MTIICTKGKDGRKYFFKNGKRISEKTAQNSKSKIKYNYSKSRKKSSSTKKSTSRKKSRSGNDKESSLNRFFGKIFVINLKDVPEKWERVEEQFKKQGIKVERFNAVDGRCIIRLKDGKKKAMTNKECEEKRLRIQKEFDVFIPKHGKNKHGKVRPLVEMLPAASLTIGTVNILREMVKNKWPYILICEDDILLEKNINKLFQRGVDELKKKKYKWDMLYLGCGGPCGNHCISYEKKGKIKHLTEYNKFYPDDKWYVCKDIDIRTPCDYLDEDYKCEQITRHTSSTTPGGTWCYAYSLKGAKKFLKKFPKKPDGKLKVGTHVDDYLLRNIFNGYFKVAAFDPPIAWHEEGAFRTASDIPWVW